MDSFEALDVNGDGSVTPEELFDEDSVLSSPELRELQASLITKLKFGAGGERVDELPGVKLADLSGDPAAAFSFDNLCLLTQLDVGRQGVADALCQKVRAAKAAEDRGQLKTRNNILNAYQTQVDAQSGKSVSQTNATRLVILAEILKGG